MERYQRKKRQPKHKMNDMSLTSVVLVVVGWRMIATMTNHYQWWMRQGFSPIPSLQSSTSSHRHSSWGPVGPNCVCIVVVVFFPELWMPFTTQELRAALPILHDQSRHSSVRETTILCLIKAWVLIEPWREWLWFFHCFRIVVPFVVTSWCFLLLFWDSFAGVVFLIGGEFPSSQQQKQQTMLSLWTREIQQVYWAGV